MVKCLGPHTFTTVGVGLIPAWGTNILQALWHSQKNKIKISLYIYIHTYIHIYTYAHQKIYLLGHKAYVFDKYLSSKRISHVILKLSTQSSKSLDIIKFLLVYLVMKPLSLNINIPEISQKVYFLV